MKLQFHQIYFNDNQLKELYSFATPYKNENLTDFFENEVIAREVPKCDAEYISFCSWRLRKKRQDGWVPKLSGFIGRPDDLSEEKILKQDFDVAVLTPKSSSHCMLHMSEIYHGQAWRDATSELKKIICVPEEVKTPIYENHFIARGSIYRDYVNNMLGPVLNYMRTNSVFFQDAGYADKKGRTDREAVARYRAKTGRNDWPIAPFVLERLFSIWINDKKLNIINL